MIETILVTNLEPNYKFLKLV